MWEMLYKNKTRSINIAATLWHVWLEKNSRVFSSKSLYNIFIYHEINNAVMLWTGQY